MWLYGKFSKIHALPVHVPIPDLYSGLGEYIAFQVNAANLPAWCSMLLVGAASRRDFNAISRKYRGGTPLPQSKKSLRLMAFGSKQGKRDVHQPRSPGKRCAVKSNSKYKL
jgi:hypothetical protein